MLNKISDSDSDSNELLVNNGIVDLQYRSLMSCQIQ